MASLNKVFLMGNLTKDPEIRYTSSGTAVGDLRIAVTSKFKDKEETLFINVTVWDRQAENCGEYLRKGSPVLVEGRLKLDEWERDGQKHSRVDVVARNIQFLGSRNNPAPGGADENDKPERPAGGADSSPPSPDAADSPAPSPDVDDTEDDDNLPF